jgi:hypothetical protein
LTGDAVSRKTQKYGPSLREGRFLAEENRMVQTSTRNATLEDLAGLLKMQHARKIDVVAPASKFVSRDGVIEIEGTEAILTDDGVTTADGRYVPTTVFDEGVSDKLGIPLPYVRRLRAERPDLYDANVNGWLHGRRVARTGGIASGQPQVEVLHPEDPRSFLLRCFRPDDEGGTGIARAMLSDRYSVMDNLDVLVAALDGVRKAGVSIDVAGCDLTDRKMYVKIVAPEVQALAPSLLRGYRSPYSGLSGSENPTVFAGFVLSNSEVGGGAFSITPRLVVQVCTNGMTITKDALRAVHLGGKMDEGTIRWTEDTEQKNIALVTAKTRDAVATFLDVEYMQKVIAGLEEQAGKPLDNAAEAVKIVAKRLTFDQATTDGVLDHFIRGGQVTAGGVMQAVTSYAQTIEDADKAYDVEAQGVRAMELAYAL